MMLDSMVYPTVIAFHGKVNLEGTRQTQFEPLGKKLKLSLLKFKIYFHNLKVILEIKKIITIDNET